jgi:hypothetical protein
MRGGRCDEHFRRGAPDHHATGHAVLRLEVADVLAQLLRQVTLVLAGLDVLPLEPLHVMLVEHRRHRLDLLEEVLDRDHVLVLVEHAAVESRLVGIIRHGIPGPELQLVERIERREVLDQRSAALAPLAETDRHELRERTSGRGDAAPSQLHAGDEGRGHCAESDTQYPELAVSWLDLAGLGIRH